jgi:nicotinamidase-related amidase
VLVGRVARVRPERQDLRVVRGLDRGERPALVICECQRGVLDPSVAIFPGLAQQAEERGMLADIARLAAAFRARDLPVVHAHVAHRPDFGGVVVNSMVTARSRKAQSMRAGTPDVEPMEGAIPEPSDYVSLRRSGLGMWYGTDLDATLRNLGVETVVLSGVSTNLALFAGAIGAVDRGYRAVLAEDASAGAVPEQHQWMITNALPLVTTIASVDDVIADLAAR